jgi:hypothetical protein
MPILTIFFGVALMAVGIGTYAGTPEASRGIGDLLPALFGLVALALGVGSLIKKDLRMHLMHGAVLLASLGVLIPLIRLVMYLAEMPTDDQMRLVRVILTVGFSGAYVYTAVQSFRAARRSRKDGKEPPKAPKPEKAEATTEP